ncbi:glyoxalase [Acuticoccus sediminis]|uniref:Glyoxalase n=1 Tax=Acuticoccus sediminis TaxID=2184697 RepID=A0A8B2P0S7_9HYPH|nr:VOC family protein [Acuticoccus sediminis]RAI04055.1 glyoxalase [Acuticoccus sediminis]
MAHRSRLGAIVVDCRTEDLSEALAFWTAALGAPGTIDPDGKYAVLEGGDGLPKLLLQAVDHDSRVHLDIETDDIPAEVARITALGGRPVAEFPRWTVMEAPTGHRFCVVRPQRDGLEEDGTLWNAD